MNIITLRIRISGKVQGVWFRASAKDSALSIGIKGKVWNEPNGDVGVIAQGAQEKLEEFIQWSHHGPQLARVENVEVNQFETDEVFSSFEIVRSPF